MKFGDAAGIVVRNLKRRKGRTFLTAVGVTIGTAAIVAMLSLGIGLKESAVRSISKFGNLTEIEVYPAYDMNGPSQQNKLNEQAVRNIRAIRGVTAVLAKIRYSGGQAEIEFERKTGSAEIIGVDAKEAKLFNYTMAEGSYLNGNRNEGVISFTLPDMLHEKEKKSRKSRKSQENRAFFPMPGGQQASRQNLVNKNVSLVLSKASGNSPSPAVKEYNIKISGMLSQGQMDWGPTIYLPIEKVREMNKWAGSSNNTDGSSSRDGKETYENLTVKVTDREAVVEVENQIKSMGYNAYSPASQLKEINKSFMVIQLILGGIGAVSLLVASISIINTMVMSILERTKEIGVMKVLGATIPNIRHLFIMEAGAIGFAGGGVGLLLSHLIVWSVNMIAKSKGFMMEPGSAPQNIAVIPLWLTLFAIAFSSIIGILAGIYPALRAAKLSPLNAIRQE